MAVTALVPIALLLVFAGGHRRRGPVRQRRLYGPDPLAAMAPPLTDDFVVPLRPIEQEPERAPLYPEAPLREYQTPLAPRTAPPIEQGPQWDSTQSPPPYAPAEGGFYPPLDPTQYGPPPVEQTGAFEPLAPPPAPAPGSVPQWEPVPNTTRQQAARALAEHILTHRGSSRDRALIRRLQGALGVRVDGLIGQETLGAIARYGALSQEELNALGVER